MKLRDKLLSGSFILAAQLLAIGPMVAAANGGNSMSIEQLDGNWRVIEAKGLDIANFREMTLRFTGTKLFGFAPCKSFKAILQTIDENDTILVSKFKPTPHICDAALMREERRYFDLVRGIRSFHTDALGRLVLASSSAPVIVAERKDD